MTAEAMTFDSLVSDIQVYCERYDVPFVDQINRFIMMAEYRISKEAKGLGLLRYVNGAFNAGSGIVAKPDRWRETRSFAYVDSNGDRQPILARSYEYCRTFWPNSGVKGTPRFYADYDFEHFLVVAPPVDPLDFELGYYERPGPLSDAQQTNWTTQNVPDLLLYACLLEAQPFLKMPERIAEFQGLYDRALAALKGEDAERKTDGDS